MKKALALRHAVHSNELGALGVVYGDIGTSPLYAMGVTFFAVGHGLEPTLANVLGVLSLFIWSLIVVVTIKYNLLIMRADHKGEGGIFALLGLMRDHEDLVPKKLMLSMVTMIIIGAALLFGDGVITPAISVLSSIEGLGVMTESFRAYVVPITIVILVGLFAVQRQGTAKIGMAFGPVMVVWFALLICLGAPKIIRHPEVLAAINPLHALGFLRHHGVMGSLVVLGTVVLCITGGEALYADMGHFGAKAIRRSWFYFVLPSLVLAYLGQGARLLDPEPIKNGNLFFAMVPSWAMVPVVILATMATVIASQALISGAFSLSRQAINLSFMPRLRVLHTSKDHEGQIYLPAINRLMLFGTVVLVVLFKSSEALAAAYGIAVTGTMAITTIGFYVVARYVWRWPGVFLVPICLVLVLVDLVFFGANALKFFEGGYIPLLIASSLFFTMNVWSLGRRWISHHYATNEHFRELTVSAMQKFMQEHLDVLSSRTLLVMASRPIQNLDDRVPVPLASFVHQWGPKCLPRNLIFCTINKRADVPFVEEVDRAQVITFLDQENCSITSLQLQYGFLDFCNVREALLDLKNNGVIKLAEDPKRWLILMGRERMITKPKGWFDRFRLRVFDFLLKITPTAEQEFGLDGDGEVTTETVNI